MINPVIQQLKGKLIVSCQAYMGEPLRHPETMAQMARACELGGAGGIRCQGLSDISAIKGRTEVPVIGIWKEGHEGVYITPTLRHARACVAAQWMPLTARDPTARRLKTPSARSRKKACSSWPIARRSRTSVMPSPSDATSPRPRSRILAPLSIAA